MWRRRRAPGVPLPWRLRAERDPAHVLPIWEHDIYALMQVVAKKALREFWLRHPRSKTPLSVWHATVERVCWGGPGDIKTMFGTTVDFIGDNRVIFDIGGNKYRLIVRVSYKYQRVLIKFVGTHEEYDRIDPDTVSWISGRSRQRTTTSGRSPK